jgi:hypothetical protein
MAAYHVDLNNPLPFAANCQVCTLPSAHTCFHEFWAGPVLPAACQLIGGPCRSKVPAQVRLRQIP